LCVGLVAFDAGLKLICSGKRHDTLSIECCILINAFTLEIFDVDLLDVLVPMYVFDIYTLS